MKNFSSSSFTYKLQHLCSCLIYKFSCFCNSTWCLITYFYQHVLLGIDPFLIQLFYFLSFSSLGFCLLKVTKPRTKAFFTPSNVDLFFTAVSAVTTSSMSTVEMEVFSEDQLVILTFLMFIGGEVFTSMLGLHFSLSKLQHSRKALNFIDQIELSMVTVVPNSQKPDLDILEVDGHHLKYNSIKFLCFVVPIFLLVNHIIGFSFIFVYLALISSAKNVLKKKGLSTLTFLVFTTVSTFSGCGFIPTNENMMVFNKNSGLLLILIPQVLLGNTLFPSGLRFSVWFLGNFFKKHEAEYLLRNSREVGYFHWLSARHSWLVLVSAFGFIVIQFVMFCGMEWSSEGLSELNFFEKIVAVLFQTVSTRHAGENIVDLSKVAPPIWVLFVLMMYLPPYTCFMGTKDDENCSKAIEGRKKRRGKLLDNLLLSQLSYLLIAIILICITERKEIHKDPLNFSVFNITVEVISAYGNVGFTMGYNCERKMKPDVTCVNKNYGFSGKWSDKGKFILIVVMFFGRLKKYNMDKGRAWKLM